MVKRIARIADGVVVNTEAWPDDVVLTSDMIDVTDLLVPRGSLYDGAEFSPPPPPPESCTPNEIADDGILDDNDALPDVTPVTIGMLRAEQRRRDTHNHGKGI